MKKTVGTIHDLSDGKNIIFLTGKIAMKAYIQSVIVTLSLTGMPAYGECASVFPELNIDGLVQEAMHQLAEEIKSEIPGEVAKLQQLIVDSLVKSQDGTGMDAAEQSTDTTEE